MVAYQKRVPSPDKKWTKNWQLQMIIAAVSLFVVSQLLNFLGVRSSLLNPTVEQALSSIDMFSQPREVTSKLVALDSMPLLAANDANVTEFTEAEAEPQTLTDVQPQKRTPANDTAEASSKSMSIITVPQEFIVALQESGLLQTMDERVRVAYFDRQQEQHKSWIESLKAMKVLNEAKNGRSGASVVKVENAQKPGERIVLTLRQLGEEDATASNYFIDYIWDYENDSADWNRAIDLTPNTVVVFFGILDGIWLSPAATTNSTLAVVVEKK